MKKIITLILVVLLSFCFLGKQEIKADMVTTDHSDTTYYQELNFTKIESGYLHSIAVTSEGLVVGFGLNNYGQLGDGTVENQKTMEDITSFLGLASNESVSDLSLGEYHSAVLTSFGRILIWGNNEVGQLGNGTTTDSLLPVDITNQFSLEPSETIIDISLGNSFSVALTSNGRIFTWGDNQYGQLGNNTVINSSVPIDITQNIPIPSDDTVTQIEAGGHYVGIITEQHRVLTWGKNAYGQLGNSSTNDVLLPFEITMFFNLAPLEYITSLSFGVEHSSALTSTGRLFMWGENYVGQLGVGTLYSSSPNPIPIDITDNFGLQSGEMIVNSKLGSYHSSAITNQHRVFFWGSGNTGEIGDGLSTDCGTPTDITNHFILDDSETIEVTSLGQYFSTAISSNGKVFTWGANYVYNLGNGEPGIKIEPYNIGYPLIITKDIALPVSDPVIQTALGDGFSGAITQSGQIFTWGTNYNGRLGAGTEVYSSHVPLNITNKFILNSNETITYIDFGKYFGSAISSDHRIFTWGYNRDGELGDGTTVNRYEPTDITNQFPLEENEYIIATSMGTNHSSALSSNGRVFTWGLNISGQLGDGTTAGSTVPIDITDEFHLSQGDYIIAISMGEATSFALSNNGLVFSWGGSGRVTFLGDGERRLSPGEITNYFDIAQDDKIIYIAAGTYNASAISQSGEIFTWGRNSSGQIGNGTTTEQIFPVNITSFFSLEDGEKIIQSSYGNSHASAITSNGRIFTWGQKSLGQIGPFDYDDNTTIPVELTSEINLVDGEKVISSTLGYEHSSAVTSYGRLFMWGYNDTGQVGDGTTSSYDDGVNHPTEINKIYTVHNELLYTYADEYQNYLLNNLIVSVFPEYNIENEIETIEINHEQYDSSQFQYENGRLDVLIPNAGSLGDTIEFEVNSITFKNGIFMPIEVNNSAQSILGIDIYKPTINFDYESDLYVEKDVGNDTYIAATAKDDTGEVLPVIMTGEVDWTTPGEYVVNYRATDDFENEETRSRTVIVMPTITDDSVEYDMQFNGFSDTNWVNGIDLNQSYIFYSGINYLSQVDHNKDPLIDDEYNQILYKIPVNDRLVILDRSIYFDDTQEPTFTSIQNQTIEAGTADIDWTTYMENVVDNSNQPVTLQETNDTIEYQTVGDYSVSVKAIDMSGNETSQTFNVTVEDTTPPTFDEISDQHIEINHNEIDWITFISNIVENSDSVIAKSVIVNTVNYQVSGMYNVSLQVEDESGNSTVHSFHVIVEDTIPPTFDFYNQTIEVGSNPIDWITNIVNVYDNSGSTVNKSVIFDTVNYLKIGTYEVRVKVSDVAGNETIKTISVSVVDTTKPIFDFIPEQTIEAGMTNIDWSSYILHPSDNSSGKLLAYEISDQVHYDLPGTYQVTVGLKDESGNVTNQAFSVIVIDTTAPTFTIENQTVELGSTAVDWTQYMTNCFDNSVSDLVKETVSDNVDYNQLGTYIVTVKLTDASNNQTQHSFTVNVVDTRPPSFDVQNQTIEAGTSDIDWSTIIEHVMDNSNTPISLYEVSDDVLYDTPGTYDVIVGASDASNNILVKTIKVTVIDTIAPTVIVNDQFIEIDSNPIDWTNYIEEIQDNSNTPLTILVTRDLVQYDTAGVYPVTISVMDASGNETISMIHVSVIDLEAPLVLLNPSIDTIYVGDQYVDEGVTITDRTTTSLEIDGRVDNTVEGTYIITYRVTDESGNMTSIKRAVTVVQKEDDVLFILSDAKTTIAVGETYIDSECVIYINGMEHLCQADVSVIDNTTPGIYEVTYSYEGYHTVRYVFVYNGEEQLVLYYDKDKKEGVLA